jgi:hypothetical protein
MSQTREPASYITLRYVNKPNRDFMYIQFASSNARALAVQEIWPEGLPEGFDVTYDGIALPATVGRDQKNETQFSVKLADSQTQFKRFCDLIGLDNGSNGISLDGGGAPIIYIRNKIFLERGSLIVPLPNKSPLAQVKVSTDEICLRQTFNPTDPKGPGYLQIKLANEQMRTKLLKAIWPDDKRPDIVLVPSDPSDPSFTLEQASSIYIYGRYSYSDTGESSYFITLTNAEEAQRIFKLLNLDKVHKGVHVTDDKIVFDAPGFADDNKVILTTMSSANLEVGVDKESRATLTKSGGLGFMDSAGKEAKPEPEHEKKEVRKPDSPPPGPKR